VAGGHLANVLHPIERGCVLPYLFARHVVFAANIDRPGVVDVAALEGGRVGAAVVEASLDLPARIWTPFRRGDDDFVPVGKEGVGKYQFSSAGVIDDFLLALPRSFRRVKLAFSP